MKRSLRKVEVECISEMKGALHLGFRVMGTPTTLVGEKWVLPGRSASAACTASRFPRFATPGQPHSAPLWQQLWRRCELLPSRGWLRTRVGEPRPEKGSSLGMALGS
jgi:hypothetical protein